MILVQTQIKPSQIHGAGLFAVETIKKGALVWAYRSPPDYRIFIADWKSTYSKIEEWNNHRKYGYIFPGTDFIEFPGDSAIFINHSINPNIVVDSPETMISSRDISNGEELTCDYREIEVELEDGLI